MCSEIQAKGIHSAMGSACLTFANNQLRLLYSARVLNLSAAMCSTVHHVL